MKKSPLLFLLTEMKDSSYLVRKQCSVVATDVERREITLCETFIGMLHVSLYHRPIRDRAVPEIRNKNYYESVAK